MLSPETGEFYDLLMLSRGKKSMFSLCSVLLLFVEDSLQIFSKVIPKAFIYFKGISRSLSFSLKTTKFFVRNKKTKITVMTKFYGIKSKHQG